MIGLDLGSGKHRGDRRSIFPISPSLIAPPPITWCLAPGSGLLTVAEDVPVPWLVLGPWRLQEGTRKARNVSLRCALGGGRSQGQWYNPECLLGCISAPEFRHPTRSFLLSDSNPAHPIPRRYVGLFRMHDALAWFMQSCPCSKDSRDPVTAVTSRFNQLVALTSMDKPFPPTSHWCQCTLSKNLNPLTHISSPLDLAPKRRAPLLLRRRPCCVPLSFADAGSIDLRPSAAGRPADSEDDAVPAKKRLKGSRPSK